MSVFGKIPDGIKVEIHQFGESVKFSYPYKEAFLDFADNVAQRLAMQKLGAVRRTVLHLIPEPLNVEGLLGVPQAVALFLFHHEDLKLAGSKEPTTLTVFETITVVEPPEGDAELRPLETRTYHFTLALKGL